MKDKMAEPKEVKTKAQRALEAKAKYEQLLEDGKTELLETANQAIKELGELGFAYRVLSEDEYQTLISVPRTQETAPRAPKKTGTAKPPTQAKGYDGTKNCLICKVAGHDGRQHRNQNPKAPFSAEELAARGLTPQ